MEEVKTAAMKEKKVGNSLLNHTQLLIPRTVQMSGHGDTGFHVDTLCARLLSLRFISVYT